MNQLLGFGREYMKQMRIADIALLKICLLSLGMFLGLLIKCPKAKKIMTVSTLAAFICTLIPQLQKASTIYCEEYNNKE